MLMNIYIYNCCSDISGPVEFIVMVQKGSGCFEIVEGGAAIVSGKISVPKNLSKVFVELDLPDDNVSADCPALSRKDFYKELRLRGYNYKGLFCSVTESTYTGR